MIKTLYPAFQRWSVNSSIYIISDTHLYDADRKLMGYDITEEQQLEILKKYCHRNDTLIHLGDVGKPELFKQIKSYKVLVMGNHDETVTQFKPYFDEIYTGPIWIAEKLVLSHESLSLCSGTTGNPIAFNIHGHDHNKYEPYYEDYHFHLNITQNVFGYKPLNLNTFIKKGYLKYVKSIHREIIDNATENKITKEKFENHQ